jgi:hypothetical protein
MPLGDFVRSKITKAAGGLGELAARAGFDRSILGGGQLLTYPLELISDIDRPVIRFTAYERDKPPNFVFFPCPGSISFNEGASYNIVNLGTLGVLGTKALDAGADAIQRGMAGQPLLQNLGQAGQEIIGDVDLNDLEQLLEQYIPGFQTSKAIQGRRTGTIAAPNQLQTFEGNAVRNFDFAFKMVAKSAAETKQIQKIHNFFRRYIYGDGGTAGQETTFNKKYPPVWNIDFLDMRTGGTSNKYIPKIYSCFLTGVGSTFNSSANMFHRDGAPIEVDVTLSYTETRELHRGDIDAMEEEKYTGLYNSRERGLENISTKDSLLKKTVDFGSSIKDKATDAVKDKLGL